MCLDHQDLKPVTASSSPTKRLPALLPSSVAEDPECLALSCRIGAAIYMISLDSVPTTVVSGDRGKGLVDEDGCNGTALSAQ